MAICDFMVMIKALFWNVLCDSLSIYTGGKISFCFATLSSLSCAIIHLWYYFAENGSNYAVSALTIERTIAVSVPFLAKRILSIKFTAILLAILTLPPFAYYLVAVPITAEAGKNCRWDSKHILGYIWAVLDLTYAISLHCIIDFVGVLIILFKLKQSREKRKELFGKEKISRKESQATMAMLAIAISNLVIYGTFMITRLVSLALDTLQYSSSDFAMSLKGITMFMIQLTITPHSMNLFVYLFFVPPFRKAAFCMKDISASSATKSTTT